MQNIMQRKCNADVRVQQKSTVFLHCVTEPERYSGDNTYIKQKRYFYGEHRNPN